MLEIEDHKALASAGDLTKIVVLGAILVLRRRLTLHKLKPMVLLHRLINICWIVRNLHIYIVDTSSEEPVAYRKEEEYLRRNERHEYSPEYHVSLAEFYSVECLTKLVATHHVTEVLHGPINGSLESFCFVEAVLIVRVPDFIITNKFVSKTLAGVEVQLGACGALSNSKSIINTEVL
jgi:hypothetical protein